MSTTNTGVDLTTQPVDPNTGLVYKTTKNVFRPARGTQYTTLDPTKYSRFFDQNVHLEFGQDYLDPLRAARQGAIEQAGAGLLQAGTEVVGGTLEGIGHLETGVRELLNLENDWSNWLVDIGTGMKTWSREAAPIYQDPDDIGKFRPNKWSWWMSNAPSIASTLSLMIPSSGIVKGVSMLGKGMGISNSMGKTAKFFTTSIGQAAASRLMENGMESVQTFESSYEELLGMGVSEQEARRAASVAASDSWNKNWAMLAQDIPQYMILGASINKAAQPITKPLAKRLGLGKNVIRDIGIKRSTALLGDALLEGGEEVFQYVVADRAGHLARAAVDKEYDYKPSMRDYIREGELWSSFTMGALGSTVFQTAGRKLNKLIQGGDVKDPRVENVADWAGEIKLYEDAMRVAKEQGNVVASEEATSNWAIAQAAKGSAVGNAQVFKDMLADVHNNAISDERAAALNLTPDSREFITKNYPEIMNAVNQTVDNYEVYAKKYDNDIAARLAATDVRRVRANERMNTYKDNRDALKKEIPGYENLSIGRRQIEEVNAKLRANKKAKEFYQERLDSDKELSKEEQTRYQKWIKDIEAEDADLLERRTTADKNRTADEKKSDKDINIKSAALDNYFENEERINEVTATLNELNALDSFLRSSQKKTKKRKKYKEPNLASDDPKERSVLNDDASVTGVDPQAEEIDAQTAADDLQHELNSQIAHEQIVDKEKAKEKQKVKQQKETESTGSTIEKPSQPKPEKNKTKQDTRTGTLDEFVTPIEGSDDGSVVLFDDEGNLIDTVPDKRTTHSEPPKKDESSTVLKENEDVPVQPETREFDPKEDSHTFINLSPNREQGLTEAQKFLNNPKKDLSTAELVFSIDTGEFFDKQFKNFADDWRMDIEERNMGLLKRKNFVDNVPIKVNIRNKTTKQQLDGDFYIYRASTKPPKTTPEIQKKTQKATISLRQKVLEGILNDKIVTQTNFKRSAGVPNFKGKSLNIVAALDINPAQAKLGVSKAGGNIIGPGGKTMRGTSDSYGGNVYLYVTSTANGTEAPIKLNTSKLSREHAELVFEAFEQVSNSGGKFAVEFTDSQNRTSKMTAGSLLDMLVYNGQSNTRQVPGEPRYREELISKQLYLADNQTKLVYGSNNINLRNYTPQQKEDVIQHLMDNMNYNIRLDHFENKFKKPFRIGSIEVTKNDIKAGITYKEVYLRNNFVTTNSQLDENGSSHENSNLFIEFSDIDSVNFNEAPATETKKEDKPDQDLHDFLDGEMGFTATREVKGDYEYEIGNMQEEAKWIRERLGITHDVQIVDDFIKVVTATGSKLAWSTVKDGSVKLFEHAEEGSGYHEAFHVVSLYYLTNDERNAVYEQARKKYDKPNATDEQIEEVLAEDFRTFVLTEKKIKPEPGAIRRFFNRLYNFIRDIFVRPETRVQDLSINGLFERIERGEYKEAKVRPENLARYSNYEVLREVEGFTTSQVHAITKQLLYQTVNKNNVLELTDVQDINYEPVKEWLDDLVRRVDERRALGEKWEKIYNIFKRVQDEQTFNMFTSLVDDMLLSMNIRKVIEFDEDYTVNEFDKHIKESYEYSARDNMLANVKLFIATIPADERDPFTEMVTIVDFDRAWKKIMRDLHNVTNPEEMMDRIAEKAKSSNFYKTLLEGNNHRPGLKNGTENFKTQFFTSIKKHKHNFIKLLSDPSNKRYTFIDAEMVSLAEAKVSGWSILFAEDKGLFHETTGDPNYGVIRSVMSNFDSLEKQYDKEFAAVGNDNELPTLDDRVDNILKIFDMIGVTMVKDDVLDSLANKELPIKEAMRSFIKDDMKPIFGGDTSFLGQLITIEENAKANKAGLFRRSKAIQNVGAMVAARDDDNVASVVLGPEGNKYYIYAANNFITDYITNLSYDPNFVNALQNSVGKKNSFFLSQLQNGAEISFSTMLGYKEGKDTVEYFAMEPSRDYLMKAVAIANNRLPLPTISDKKFYGFFNGFNKIDFDEASFSPDLGYSLPEDVYTLFEGYYQDELDRIAKTEEDIINAERKGKYEHLIENIHFKGYTEEGLPMLRDAEGNFTGNGTKLIEFKEFENKEFNRDNLRKMFARIIKQEIKVATQHGVIEARFDEADNLIQNSLNNLLLPSTHKNDIIKRYRALFGDVESLAVYNAIADIALNSVMVNIEMSKLFSMDPAFYSFSNERGDTFDDVTKRLAELVAPGQNLRINFTEDEFDAGVMESDSYTSATLRSHEFSSDKLYEELEKKFIADYKQNFPNMTDIDIDIQVKRKLKAYKEVDSTDGQVLISPQLYRQIAIRLGEWDNRKNLALQRILADTEQSIAQIASDIETVMQPLKMVYYGVSFRNGHAVPTYDKMSLAVLLPQMVNKTKMQKLYDIMTDENSPIPMIKFDSAVKAGNTPVTDYLKEDNSINPDIELELVPIEQPFKYLRRQQVTDPHEEERRMVGTQVKKIILQNLRADAVYNLLGKKLTGAQIADLISNLYSGLSNKGKERIEKAFNVKDGKPDIKRVYRMLNKSAIISGMPYNVVDALEIDKNTGKPKANLDTMPDRRWTETRLISKIGKAVVDLMTAGDSFIQMSAYGISKVNSQEASDLKLTDDQGRTEVRLSVGLFRDVIPNYKDLTYNEKKAWLKENFEGIGYRIPTQSQGSVISFVVKDFLPDETGNVIMLPLEFTALTGSDFDIDKLFLMRKSYYTDVMGDIQEYEFIEADNEDGTITDESKLDAIYRQIHASKLRAIDAVKEEIIGNKAERYSSFIQAIERKLGVNEAFEVESATDVLEELKREDMLSTVQRLEKDVMSPEEFKKWAEGKTAFEINHPKAMENLVIDVMKSVLTSESHIVDTKTPIDAHTGDLKDVLAELDNIRGKDTIRQSFEWHSLGQQSRIKQFYIGGKFGIGPFALHNVHHALTQIADLGINTKLNPFTNKDMNREPDKNNLARTYDRHGKLITDWFSALINAHVDIAKDPYIFRLNVMPETYNQLSYLLRLGFGSTAFYFINQPSIVENPSSKDADNASTKYYDKALALAKQEGVEEAEIEKMRNAWSNLSFTLKYSGLLLKQINNRTPRDAKWYATQAGIMKAYGFISAESFKLRELVQLTRIDGKGYGNSIGQVRLFDRRLQNAVLDEKFENTRALLNKTFLGTIKKNSIDYMQKLYGNLNISSTDGFITMLDSIVDISNTDDLRTNKGKDMRINRLANELFSSLASKYFSSLIGKGYDSTDVKDLMYGNKSVGKWLHVISQKEEYRENKLLQILKPIHNEKDDLWVIYTRADVGNDSWTRNSLTSAWRELLTDPNKEVSDFARRLIDYSFYMSGFNKGLFSFYHHIPIDALTEKPYDLDQSISYDEFIGQLKNNLTKERADIGDYYEVIRDVMLNNDYVIPEVKGAKVTPLGKKGVIYEVRHNLNLGGNGVEGQIVGAPFIKFLNAKDERVVGEYIGYRDVGPDSDKRYALIYKIVDVKGFDKSGHVFSEYGTGERSIVDENKKYPFLLEEDAATLVGKAVDNFVYVETRDRLTSYAELVEAKDEQLKQRTEDFMKEDTIDGQLPAEDGYEKPNEIHVDVPQQDLDEIDILAGLDKTEPQTVEDIEFENRIVLELIKNEYGEEDLRLARMALEKYNSSDEAKRVWDELKKCL